MFERPWIKKGIHPKIDAFWDELIARFAETAQIQTTADRPIWWPVVIMRMQSREGRCFLWRLWSKEFFAKEPRPSI